MTSDRIWAAACTDPAYPISVWAGTKQIQRLPFEGGQARALTCLEFCDQLLIAASSNGYLNVFNLSKPDSLVQSIDLLGLHPTPYQKRGQAGSLTDWRPAGQQTRETMRYISHCKRQRDGNLIAFSVCQQVEIRRLEGHTEEEKSEETLRFQSNIQLLVFEDTPAGLRLSQDLWIYDVSTPSLWKSQFMAPIEWADRDLAVAFSKRKASVTRKDLAGHPLSSLEYPEQGGKLLHFIQFISLNSNSSKHLQVQSLPTSLLALNSKEMVVALAAKSSAK